MKSKIKSKTINTGVIVSMLGVAELNWHLLQDLLGPWYGVTLIGLGMLMVYLRTITSEPVA